MMQGEGVDLAKYEQIYKQGNKRVSCDPFQIGVHSYITLDDPYNLINHFCTPNLAIKGERSIVATRDIKAGEELAYDYSSTEWTPQDYPPYYTDGWPMVCNCGGAECRKVIACFPYLPQAIQTKYLESKAIQDHILEKLTWSEERKRCYICEKELGI